MSWIRLRTEKSPYYVGRFVDENGKLIDRSTKSKDPVQAQRITDAWEVEARCIREKLFPKSQHRRVSKMMYHIATGEPLKCPTVKEHLATFVHEAAMQNEPETATSRRQTAKLFLEYLNQTT